MSFLEQWWDEYTRAEHLRVFGSDDNQPMFHPACFKHGTGAAHDPSRPFMRWDKVRTSLDQAFRAHIKIQVTP